jgi:hypothetical protein
LIFLAQNKHRSKVHKENIEEYKIFTHYSLC